MPDPILQIKNLHVDFKTPSGVFHAVKGISFDVKHGQTVALVGESGSGKSVSALSAMRLLPYPMASHPKGSILFEGDELLDKGESYMRAIRGQQMGMIFQEPQSALNPLHTIERQIAEVLKVHQGMSNDKARARVLELLDMVQLPHLKQRLKAYPHELSGGQRQRIMIAMALANNPELLIADEPTTALDVTVQAQILELLQDLQKELNMAMLLITHDLSVVEKMADYVCVMQHGEMMEQNDAKTLFTKPTHEYTKMLLNTIPRGAAKPIAKDAPSLIKGTGVKVYFPNKKSFFGKPISFVKAVDGIDLTIRCGETLGVVGESGSGKSTLGLAALRLLSSQGEIDFDGVKISALNQKSMRPMRERMQIVFQDPYASLSPRMTVAQIIEEGLKLHRKNLGKEERDALVVKALQDVHMDADTRHRYPHEFSGGQRQRICIARAMVLNPEFVVLDEPTSALDVSVQAEVVDLLRELQEKHNLTYMFISHDLRVVRAMSHHVMVMKDGKVIETGSAQEVFENPKQDYTKALLDAAMNLKVRKTA
ncbi:MAG: ABC transporter ATP-binding protein [Alphaproteobacteria bacterium]